MEKENLAAYEHEQHCEHEGHTHCCGDEHTHRAHHHNDHDHHEHGHCSCGHTHGHEHSHDHGSCCDHHHDHGDGCNCGHDHNHEQDPAEARKELIKLGIGALLLVIGLLLKSFADGTSWVSMAVLLAAFAVAAADIIIQAIDNIRHGEIFGESFLMGIAGIGAVCIGEIPEGVMVFLLYRLGEYLQTKAVASSRKSISSLLDVRPDHANLLENGQTREVDAERVQIGQSILVRPGEKVPLDGVVLSGTSQLDTAALTGESVPRDIGPGQQVMAGCINLSGALEIQVEKSFGESTASKILEMVEHASEKKAASEKFITRFARVYTPIVCLAAVIVAVLPPLAGWMSWDRSIYSALCFLVVSCPCALVISVPLSFFAGIGRASREGVLVKGGNHLETLAEAQIIAFDKTGTLTEGRFSVSDCVPAKGISREKLLEMAALAECRSTHPIAQSILAAHGKPIDEKELTDYQEISGHGVSVVANHCKIIAGKSDYLTEKGVDLPEVPTSFAASTMVYVAADGIYQGVILLRDTPKRDAKAAVSALRSLGMRETAMLSGDNKEAVSAIAQEIGLDWAKGELLPQDKLAELEQLRSHLTGNGKLLYAGDGINDTPVLAAADIGIAMGGLGADAAIETADVIIMGDEPSKIASGIRIARRTNHIAKENIVFAIAIKVLVMILIVLGFVELWAGVFADVGVCMLCVLNTLRINQKKSL
ncbi:MAG: cadmium-translocating P-type ATPase [Oscillospiraceae bacterium]|nr:cadmium-translocating P-type ATPase [Oscillospiraceae bacterium]